MLTRYDPDRAPDPQRWLAEDSGQKMEIIRRYHRRERIQAPNADAHAVIHEIVENQVAMGDEIPVAATLQRLMGEGLTRHEAVHAIGTVLLRYLDRLMRNDEAKEANTAYYAELATTTADEWFALADEDPDDEEDG